MKKFICSILRMLVCVTAFISTAAQCRAELIGYDGFDYTVSSMNNVEGGAFWGYQNVSPAGHKVGMSSWNNASGFSGVSVSSGGLLYTGDSGVVREYSGPLLDDETKSAVNEVNFAKKVYYRISMTRGSGATWCGVSSFDFGTERLFFGLFPDGTGKFSIYNQNTFTRLALSSVNVNVGQTYTLVAKVDFATDTLSLYVDPNIANSEGSNTPIATVPYTGSDWSTAVRLGSGGGGLVSWDNLYVATTWESLREYEVTNLGSSGAGSLRTMISLARISGGRVTFAPTFGSLFGVTQNGGIYNMIRFKRDTPGTLEQNVPISGLAAGVKIAAIDFQVTTGVLYALGITEESSSSRLRLYRIDQMTGAATSVGAGSLVPSVRIDGAVSMDFDPQTGLARVTSRAGLNALLDASTGGFSFVATDIVYAGGDSNPVELFATAFSDEVVNPSTPVRFFGFRKLGLGLVEISGSGPSANPNNGQAFVLHAATDGPEDITGFDIADDSMAFLSGYAPGYSLSNFLSTLYQYDVESGVATRVGLIGNGVSNVVDIAAAPSLINITTGPLTVDGGNAFVVDGLATAPGITLAGGATEILVANGGPSIAFRNMNFTRGKGLQGGAVSYAAPAGAEANGLLSFERCTLYENAANSRGGALSMTNGNLRMSRSTMSGNSSGTGGASAIYQSGSGATGNINLLHCTVIDNHTSSIIAANAPQALVVPSAKVLLRHCLIAGNTNAAGLPPDIGLTSNISIPPSVDHCLIGVGTGTSSGNTVVNGTNGNRAGTTAAPLPALTVPLGSYGGPTFTAPPLPDSLAVGLATTSTASSDQRGLTVNGVPDAGATEFRGASDLFRWWGTDWDDDGSPYGVEFAVGTDPYISDRNSPSNFRFQLLTGDPVLTFNLATNARPYTRWVVKRSFDLASFPEEIYRFNGPTTTGTAAPGIFAGNSGGLFLLRDQPPNPPRAFYRLEAVLVGF